MDHAGLVALQLGLVVVGVGEDDDGVPLVDQARRRAVDLDRARSPLARDRVGLKAGPVVDVEHVHLLVLEDVRRLQQLAIDRDRPDVMQVAGGDRRPVDLGLQHHALHQAATFPASPGLAEGVPAGISNALSISRTSPIRAARTSKLARASVSHSWKVSGSTSARYSGLTPKRVIASRAASTSAWAERSPP